MNESVPILTRAEVNDLIRASGQAKLFLYSSVENSADKESILRAVQSYVFPETEDPNEENDFAVFTIKSQLYFFSIDRLSKPNEAGEEYLKILLTVGRAREF